MGFFFKLSRPVTAARFAQTWLLYLPSENEKKLWLCVCFEFRSVESRYLGLFTHELRCLIYPMLWGITAPIEIFYGGRE